MLPPRTYCASRESWRQHHVNSVLYSSLRSFEHILQAIGKPSSSVCKQFIPFYDRGESCCHSIYDDYQNKWAFSVWLHARCSYSRLNPQSVVNNLQIWWKVCWNAFLIAAVAPQWRNVGEVELIRCERMILVIRPTEWSWNLIMRLSWFALFTASLYCEEIDNARFPFYRAEISTVTCYSTSFAWFAIFKR